LNKYIIDDLKSDTKLTFVFEKQDKDEDESLWDKNKRKIMAGSFVLIVLGIIIISIFM